MNHYYDTQLIYSEEDMKRVKNRLALAERVVEVAARTDHQFWCRYVSGLKLGVMQVCDCGKSELEQALVAYEKEAEK